MTSGGVTGGGVTGGGAPWWRRVPLRARMAALAALAVAVAVAGAVAVAYVVVRQALHVELDRSLQRQAAQVAREVRSRGFTTRTGTCAWLTTPCAQIVRGDGTVEPDGAGLPVTPRVERVANGRSRPFFLDAAASGLPVRVYTMPLGPDGSHRALQVGARSDNLGRTLDRVRLALLATLVAGAALAALLGYLVASGALRPVSRLTRAAERIAATGDPGLRMSAAGSDELARLAASFNAMLAALEESVTAQRRLVADASHELRTPLTSLRADIDLLDELPPPRRDRVRRRLRAQLAGLGDLVGDLIELARGDEPAGETEDVRLDRLAEHCAAQARTRWPDVEFALATEPVVVAGEPRRLARALANLLDNAAKFGGGRPVEVRVSPHDGPAGRAEAGGGEVVVRDHGPGIDPADLPHVFDRFYRATAARGLPGSGLGLAIVAQVAREHGARVSAEPAPGGGTLIRLAFA
ncbi:HAMP domain-containing sensor histidine kinase [Actinomadura opuntiae]|uniref:HAMP domain-containing sensor histidine kinase n=1 Tax=Actinomadura sp. OS1-43 TaxID=604315 RepID=UPI00255B1E50|nr:HAMP domain-containing sensor histidine kinase [Actinomadura sp. OS1-43]MDL4814339.1 HAMP domain-containing sensor histidine kinase [Actinomadura sp. OS1-43]